MAACHSYRRWHGCTSGGMVVIVNSYRILELDVIRWAEDRQIIPNSTPIAQAGKTLEEAGELLESAARMKAMLDTGIDRNASIYQAELKRYRDAVGDIVVTLINGCALADVDLVDCLEMAYEEIKDRKGTLMPNGVFVKA